MATVQGAFVGIVFSIFVLASQVSASQFTPLTLEQLSKSRWFAGLLCFYILAILSNVYFIHSQSLPGPVSIFPTDWNTVFGIGAGLTTASLLSLLVARELLAELTTPEHLLERTAASVSTSTFNKESDTSKSTLSSPTRTPLLTIERILLAAHDEDDEYTAQQSIYQLWKAIDRLITPNKFLRTRHEQYIKLHTNDLDLERILQYWSTAVEYGSKDEISRIQLTAAAHRQLLVKLLRADEVSFVVEQLGNLRKLTIAEFDHDQKDSVLLRYDELAVYIAEHDSSEPLTNVIQHHAEYTENRIDHVRQSGEISKNNTIISTIVCNYIMILENVWLGDLIPETNRSRTSSVLSQLDRDLEKIYKLYDDQADPSSHKQTLLTDIQQRVIASSSGLDKNASQPAKRYISLLSEISVTLEYNPNTVANDLRESTERKEPLKSILIGLQEWKTDSAYRPELRILDVDVDQLECFIDELQDELQDEMDSH